ncbi:galactosyldiacylglycerol synthase [Oscillospiraceae bacterium OttesenSCG-928-F05]|nr:galactosyldiacylglycerol synthase [Oscillospiraceae bacterium OttesenSCG-928-F05]
MKVLILSITAGYGHHATAKAVEDALNARGVSAQSIDMLEYISKTLYKTVDKGYEISTKYMAQGYGEAYRMLAKNQSARRRAVSTLISDILASRFRRIYNEFAPDVVVCTHVISAVVMNEMKKRGNTQAAVYGIVTDYTFHPFWDGVQDIEYVVTGSPLMRHRALAKGIRPDQFLPLGIPIHSKFQQKRPREAAAAELSFDPGVFTLLYMSGSMGFGNIIEVIEQMDALDAELQIICVCGRNEKAYEQVSQMVLKKPIRLYGFTDEVDKLMDACDCVITKPGGLTTSECLSKGLPMILINPIPGQEQHNIDFFVNNGAALRCNRDFLVDEAIYYLYHNGARLQSMREALGAIALPSATDTLCDHIMTRPVL